MLDGKYFKIAYRTIVCNITVAGDRLQVGAHLQDILQMDILQMGSISVDALQNQERFRRFCPAQILTKTHLPACFGSSPKTFSTRSLRQSGLHPGSDFSVISRLRTGSILKKTFQNCLSNYHIQYYSRLRPLRSWSPSARNLPEPMHLHDEAQQKDEHVQGLVCL